MKKKYIYITLAAFAVLGSACSKNSAIEGPDGQSEYMISFGKIDVKADGEDPVPEDPVRWRGAPNVKTQSPGRPPSQGGPAGGSDG